MRVCCAVGVAWARRAPVTPMTGAVEARHRDALAWGVRLGEQGGRTAGSYRLPGRDVGSCGWWVGRWVVWMRRRKRVGEGGLRDKVAVGIIRMRMTNGVFSK